MRQVSWFAAIACGMLLTLGVSPANAQLNTQHIKGTVGLKAGSQPPPDVYFRGFVKFNYQWEVYARTTTKGSAMTVRATFLLKPVKLPG